MEFKGTLGEWEVCKTSKGIYEVLVGEDKKELIAIIGCSEPNANLIASAPKMLKTLIHLNNKGGLGLETHEMIRDALKDIKQ